MGHISPIIGLYKRQVDLPPKLWVQRTIGPRVPRLRQSLGSALSPLSLSLSFSEAFRSPRCVHIPHSVAGLGTHSICGDSCSQP